MDLNNYIGRKIKLVLKNNYYYVGLVISADENSLDLKDVKGQFVSLSKDSIFSIQEVSNA